MLDGYFSKRYRLRPQPVGLIYEQVPESARTGLCQILDGYFQNGTLSTNQLYFNISHAVHIDQENMSGKVTKLPRDTSKAIEKLIMECEWWQFYDICEVIPRSLNPYYSDNTVRADIHEKINTLFKNEKLGFEIIEGGLVEKVDANFSDASIKNTRYLVKDPNFKEVGELFERALKEVYYKTQPDFDKCINDMVLATEAVLKTLNNGNVKLSSFIEIIDDLAEKGIIPRQIDGVIRNTYLLMGDRDRRTYGTNRASNIGVDEAEFVLAITAAIITYLITKSRQLGNTPQDSNDRNPFLEYQPVARS
jgi:hypothetical protein